MREEGDERGGKGCGSGGGGGCSGVDCGGKLDGDV